MKKLLFVPIAAILMVLFSYSAPGGLGNDNPEIVYRGQIKEEAFSFVMCLIKGLPQLNNNGYNVSLPTHKDFEVLYRKPELLEKADENSLEKIFYEEIYDVSKFGRSLEIVRQTEDVVKKALRKLAVLENNWGFKIKQKYEIVLTLYGPGGNYTWTDEVGMVTIKIDEGAAIKSKEFYAETIVHEIVHIGIEENIVQKYNLSHCEKERLVDLICSFYLKDFMPWYENQKKVDKNIDNFINEQVVIGNLPSAIETFVIQYPRDSSSVLR